MALQILVDSASDITPDEAKRLKVVHIPLTVSFGDSQYQDGVNLTHRQFYEKLIESDTLPMTSQASPAVFQEVCRPLVEAGDEVVIIALSSQLSGTCQSACLAASEFGGRVHVVDSENVCVGERLLVQRAVELRAQGMGAQELVNALNREKKDIRVLAVLDTLEYLKKGGRVSAAAAFAGGLLSIKPVVTVADGKVQLCGKARGSRNGGNLLRRLIAEGGGVDFTRPYCVAYSGLSDAMLQKYMDDNADLWQTHTRALPVYTVGSVIGTHVGPDAIAVAYFEKQV
ncbi:MAG: DegV family protein [bacterium]|nr:DegV family protein [bacterium]